MPLGTVRVPEALEPLFREAEKLVSLFFAEQRQDPTRGTIEIVGERYLLIRAAALSVEFFQVVDDLYGEHRREEGETFARNILFDLAHALGKSDARNFHAKMNLHDPIAKLSAGPVHFAYSGWAFVDIFPESRPSPDEYFSLVYDHPYSFESDAWLRAGKRRDFPVCIMSAGYSSGWCEESFGVKLVASEIMCRARHDETCRFIMAHPDNIEAHVEQYRAAKPHLAHQVRNYQIPDFFARKRMEEDLRRGIEDRTHELQAANAALRKEIEEREAVEQKLRQVHKLEAVASLAGGVAHDFNNLIAIMLTRTSRLASRLAVDDPIRGELAEIQTAAERAAQLTRKLLAFGQVELLQRAVIDVDVVLGELAPLLASLVGEDTALELRAAGGSVVVGDRGQLEQLVLNLVLNARDAMPRGGRLVVETSTIDLTAPLSLPTGTLEPGRHVRLVVEDTGVGMGEETMAKMFDPFFTTKPLTHGTGLGLSTVYGIVRQANGGVGVTSTLGSGTRFAVYLPAAARSPQPAVKPAAKPPGGTETILVVEDQDALGDAIRDTLEDHGYRVVLVEPEAAIELVARGEHVDLLVTDVVMPRISGSELAQQLSALRPAIKVMFMSGYTRDAVLRKGIVDQSATFLAKPFVPDQLVRTVRLALDGKPRTDGKS